MSQITIRTNNLRGKKRLRFTEEWLGILEVEDSGGNWVTINGNPVYIKGGGEGRAWTKQTDGSRSLTTKDKHGFIHQQPGVSDAFANRCVDAYEKLPERETKAIWSVQIMKDEEATDSGYYARNLATYSPVNKRIEMYETALEGHPESETETTMTHEVGHHVFDKRLAVESKEEWRSFWKENKDAMPTEYAKTKASEGFAETYAYVRTGKGVLSPVKSAFDSTMKGIKR